MTILAYYHFGTYRTFKEYYQNYTHSWLKKEFLTSISYNRFVELMPRAFFKMILFMKLYVFGKCTGTTFVGSTMFPVYHNVRRYFNKVFAGLAKSGKGTMGWCHGFKLHLLCNDSGEVITFSLTGANVNDRVVEYGLYLQRYSKERYLLTEGTSNRNSSKICSFRVFTRSSA